MTESSLAARAAAGAKHLDSIEPGWFNRINLDKFDMSEGWQYNENVKTCILCQLSPKLVEFDAAIHAPHDFPRGRIAFKVNEKNQINLGFYLRPHMMEDYPILTECWRDEILARREATEKHDA